MRCRQPQHEQERPGQADVGRYPGQVHGDPGPAGRRPHPAHVGLRDEKLQPGAEGDPGWRAGRPRGGQVRQLVQQDEGPPDGGVDRQHQADPPAPDQHVIAGQQRRMERQHDHARRGEPRHHDRRERMQQPADVLRAQPGEARPSIGVVLAQVVIDRADEPELVERRHEIGHREPGPGLRPQPRCDLIDGQALPEERDDPVRHVRYRDEVAGLRPSDHPAVAVATLAQRAQPHPRAARDAAVDAGRRRRRCLHHRRQVITAAESPGRHRTRDAAARRTPATRRWRPGSPC